MLGSLLPKNEHILERGLRIAVGLVLVSAVFVGPHAWWGWSGVVPLLTGLLGSCPAYTLFGLSTCEHQSRTTT